MYNPVKGKVRPELTENTMKIWKASPYWQELIIYKWTNLQEALPAQPLDLGGWWIFSCPSSLTPGPRTKANLQLPFPPNPWNLVQLRIFSCTSASSPGSRRVADLQLLFFIEPPPQTWDVGRSSAAFHAEHLDLWGQWIFSCLFPLTPGPRRATDLCLSFSLDLSLDLVWLKIFGCPSASTLGPRREVDFQLIFPSWSKDLSRW